MERFDFPSAMTVLMEHMNKELYGSQVDLMYLLFDDFAEKAPFIFDNGLVNRWLKGKDRLSPQLSTYYADRQHQYALCDAMEKNILSIMDDPAMAAQELMELLIRDPSVSDYQKRQFRDGTDFESDEEIAAYLTALLCFAMSRPFQKREQKKLTTSGRLSPVVTDLIFDSGIPRPCGWFRGRQEELEALHDLLREEHHVFLHGIPGIGKSELAKAYAKRYESEYTNILYIPCDSDLRNAIIDLDFADDLADEDDTARFKRHNRFLKSLKSDTLLIIDNFNEPDDPRLAMLLGYRCRILITTRNRFEHKASMELTELDEDSLFRIVNYFYSDAEEKRDTVSQMIQTVHHHTFAVELAAGLLSGGILRPEELLERLQTEGASMNAADKIRTAKDGRKGKATYHDHIRTLFALFRLTQPEQDIMRNMALMPVSGIPVRLFALWLWLGDANTVNDLVELGLIQPVPGRQIALHPMIREVAEAEFHPSIRSCAALVDALHQTCLYHGLELNYNRWVFQSIEEIIIHAENDDMAEYLRLLEDAFFYMEKYRYHSGMERILQELTELLQDDTLGTDRDRALLLQCRWAVEKNPAVSVRYLEEAAELFPAENEENAELLSNLHCNIGQCYLEMGKPELARLHMEQGIHLLEDYGFAGYHDSVVQIVNYASFLASHGEAQRGYDALKKLVKLLQQRNHTMSDDYATVLHHLAIVCGMANRFGQAERCLYEAMAIYEQVYASMPELLEEKRRDVGQTMLFLRKRAKMVNS